MSINDNEFVSTDVAASYDAQALVAAEAGSLADSPAHAFVHGLRVRRDETQLTQVVGAIARTDAGFGRAFVKALVDQAQIDCPHTGPAFAAMGELPSHLVCTTERTLYDEHGGTLGRADLIFEDAAGDPFALVVENKLYATYGERQLERYQAALRLVRGHGGRGGLLSVTRDVPTTGELQSGADEWLGSVRWAKLLPRLRKLPIHDDGVAAQWRLLLDVLDEQGDLGMTTIDAEAVRGWSHYFAGRQQLQWLLEQVFTEVLAHTRTVLRQAHRSTGRDGTIANLWYKPRARKVLIQHTQGELQFGISVPGSYTEQVLRVGIWMEDPGAIGFGVTVAPRDAGQFLDRGDQDLRRQIKKIAAAGFEQVGTKPEWYSSHPGELLLTATDAPAVLLQAVSDDISTIARSGILGYDLRTQVPARYRRKSTEPWG